MAAERLLVLSNAISRDPSPSAYRFRANHARSLSEVPGGIQLARSPRNSFRLSNYQILPEDRELVRTTLGAWKKVSTHKHVKDTAIVLAGASQPPPGRSPQKVGRRLPTEEVNDKGRLLQQSASIVVGALRFGEVLQQVIRGEALWVRWRSASIIAEFRSAGRRPRTAAASFPGNWR
jgi:hypothetical protein